MHDDAASTAVVHRTICVSDRDRGRWTSVAAPASLLLALNSSAIHLGFVVGALLGGLVVDAAGAGSLWMLAVACCGAGLILHEFLTWEVRS